MSLQLPTNTLFGMYVQREAGTGAPTGTPEEVEAANHLALAGGYAQVLTSAELAALALAGDVVYFSTTDLGIAPVKNTTVLPPEINPNPFSGGAYSTGTWGEGPVSMIARLDDNIGWPLLQSMGSVITTDTSASATNAEYLHTFAPFATDQAFLPWSYLFRVLPHVDPDQRVIETLQDAHVRSLTLSAASSSPVTVDVDYLARSVQQNYAFDIDYDDSVWGTPAFDGFEDFAVTNCCGGIEIDSQVFKATQVSLTVTNNLLQPAQSIVIGSMHPTDFPALTRSATITVNFLVEDYGFYMNTFAPSIGYVTLVDANVECPVYIADIDAEFCTQTEVDNGLGGSVPRKIRFIGNEIAWSIAPLRITPNQPVVLQATGTVLRADTAANTLRIEVENETANYDVATA